MLSKEETLEKINISLPSYAAEKISYASDSKFQEKEAILQKILKMRKIASNNYYNPAFRNVEYYKLKNYIFLEQAKFMEDVVDDYDKVIVPEYSYVWNYESLEIPELRTYFTWRSKVRRGEYPKIPVGYIFIYFSELINLIGVSSKEKAFDKLVDLINYYYDSVSEIFFQRIFEKLPKDFIINYGLPLQNLKKVKIKENFVNHYGLSSSTKIEKEDKKDTDAYYQSMLRVYKKDYTNILNYLAKNSNYKILDSKFYQTKYGFLIEKAIPDVFQKLEEYFKEKDLDFRSTVLGKKEKNQEHHLFQYLCYYETRENINYSVVISEIEEYYFQGQKCLSNIYKTNPNTRIFLGIILKQIEARLREKTGYKRKVKVNLTDLENLPIRRNVLCKKLEEDRFLEVINQAVDSFLIEKQKEVKKEMFDRRKSEILIDVSKFDSIRESTLRIQEKLVTEEEKQEEVELCEKIDSFNETLENKIKIEEIPEQETVIEMGTLGFLNSLTKVEVNILNKIMNNTPRLELESIAKEQSLLLEVLIENINLKALDYMGDNLIEDLIDKVSIYEDYIDEIKTEIKKLEV